MKPIKEDDLNPGVYAIECVKTGKVYIGESMRRVKRINQHFKDLYNGTHSNRALQEDYRKYGEFYFKVHWLERIPYPSDLFNFRPLHGYMKLKLILLLREYYYIKNYDIIPETNFKKTYNKKNSVREVYETNQFPKYDDYGAYKYEWFERYDLRIALKNLANMEIDKLDMKSKTLLWRIANYLSDKEKMIPYKPGYTSDSLIANGAIEDEEDFRNIEESNDIEINEPEEVVIKNSVENNSELPYFFNSVRIDYFGMDYGLMFDGRKRLDDYIKSLIPKGYDYLIVFYYLYEKGYLIRTNGTPKFFPSKYALENNLFCIYIENYKKCGETYKIVPMENGKELIKRVIDTIEDWIYYVPTNKKTNLTQLKKTEDLHYDNVYNLISAKNFVSKYKEKLITYLKTINESKDIAS